MFSDYSNFIFLKKITYQQSFKVPVVCFGNIYLGEQVRHLFSIFVSKKELILRKKRPAIIKKYYSAHFDEHNLIRNELNYLFL